MIITIEASEVRVGDYVYDREYFAMDKWVRVHKVELYSGTSNSVIIDVGHCCIWKHPRQGIAVRRT